MGPHWTVFDQSNSDILSLPGSQPLWDPQDPPSLWYQFLINKDCGRDYPPSLVVGLCASTKHGTGSDVGASFFSIALSSNPRSWAANCLKDSLRNIARTGPDYNFFHYEFTAFFYDFVTMLREHSLPYRPMFSLVFKPKNWQ